MPARAQAPSTSHRPPRQRRCARRSPRRRARGVLRLHPRRRRRHRRRRASSRAATWRACSRCPGSRSAARCSSTTIRRACSSRRSADYDVAARMHDDGIGFGDHRQRRARSSTSSSKSRGATRRTPLDPQAIDADLGPDGPIAREHPRYEDRPSQRDDGRARSRSSTTTAASACSRRGPASASRSAISCPRCGGRRRTSERTVVSTNTINLQEQLVGKDLPFLARGARRPAGPLRAAQGVAQLPLPAAARAGAVGAARRCSRRRWRASSPRSRRGPTRTTDGSLERPADAAARRSVGRGRPPSRTCARGCKCPHFERVLRVQGAPRRRRRPTSSSSTTTCCSSDVAVRRVDAELGRRRGAARVRAAHHRRRASPRGRRRGAPRRAR